MKKMGIYYYEQGRLTPQPIRDWILNWNSTHHELWVFNHYNFIMFSLSRISRISTLFFALSWFFQHTLIGQRTVIFVICFAYFLNHRINHKGLNLVLQKVKKSSIQPSLCIITSSPQRLGNPRVGCFKNIFCFCNSKIFQQTFPFWTYHTIY